MTLRQRLASHRTIGLDTSIFIYHFELHSGYRTLTERIFEAIEQGEWQAVTSVVTLMELTVHAWQEERMDLALFYESLLDQFPNLNMPDVTRAVARRAAQLRARHRVRPADALQVATALVHGATCFVTNDRRLSRLSAELDIVGLGDFSTT